MNIQLISLLISVFAGFLIVLSFFAGAVRGLKKSVFRLVWILVCGVICLFVAGLIAKLLVNMNISFLHLKINGQEASTLPEYLELFIKAKNGDVGSMIADNPKLMELCTKLATLVMSLVVFELLFWLTKWLLWPVWAIFAHKFFGKKKKTETGRPKKQKKHGGFGALVGIGIGFVICMFTFVPVVFINSAIMEVENQTKVDDSSPGALTDNLGDKAEYLFVYENSIVAKVFRYTGIELLQKGMSNFLTTTNFEGNKISLSGEISTFAPIYVDYQKISNYNLNDLTKEDIDEVLPIVDDAQSRVLSSGIVKSLYNELAPYIAKNVLTNENYFIKIPKFENEIINNTFRDVIRAFCGITQDDTIDTSKLVKLDDIKSDISKVISIAKEVNGTDLIKEILAKNITLEVLQENLTEALGERVITQLFELKTISTLVPVVTEPCIELGISFVPTINYEGNDVSIQFKKLDAPVTTDNVRDFLNDLTLQAIKILQGIDKNTPIYVNADNFVNIGKILDSAKIGDVISSDTFDSMLNYAIVFGKKNIKSTDLNVNIKQIALDMCDNVSEIGSFEQELGYFGNAYKIYLEADDLLVLDVCRMLDEVKNTVLYTESLDSIVENGAILARDYLTDSDLPIDAEGVDEIVESIKSVNSFVLEYSKLQPIIDLVDEIVNAESPMDEFVLEDNIKRFGRYLDEAIEDESVILSQANCKVLLKGILEKLELPEGFEDHRDEIKQNVDDITSFENEFNFVFKILNVEFETIEDFKDFIDTELLKDDGTSKSALISARLLYNLTIDIANKIEIEDIDVKDDIIDMIEEDRDSDPIKNILDVLGQIDLIETKIADLQDVPANITDGNYLVSLGEEIDLLTTDFDLLINSTAKHKIGDYVSQQINTNVQNDATIINPSIKQAVAEIYIKGVNHSDYGGSYKNMFTAYRDALELS